MPSKLNDIGVPVSLDPSEPGRKLRAVTPHASNNLPDGVCRGLLIGVAGDISVIAVDDTDAVTVAVGQGLFPVAVKAVRASGTTATGIVAIY